MKWKKGQSSTSNPSKTSHREKARKGFLKSGNSTSGLTEDAIRKLNRIHGQPGGTPMVPSVKSDGVESAMESLSMRDDDESYVSSATTVASYMSQYSTHTNASFSKLVNCEQLNDRRKEMVAALAASTEAINEQEGTQNSTEYFLIFVNSLAALEDVERADPIVGLMAMLMKSVPEAVLQDKFTVTRGVLLKLVENFDQNGKFAALIDANSCLSVLIARQRETWSTHVVNPLKALLAFAMHSKPKVRKAATRNITWLLKTVCEDMGEKQHPCSKKVTEYCLEAINSAYADGNSVTVLHILGLVEFIFGHLHADDIKAFCEGLLSLCSDSNINIRLHCYKALYQLFDSETSQLSDDLTGKLIKAIVELKPGDSDVRQIVAWITVLKKATPHCPNAIPNCVRTGKCFQNLCGCALRTCGRKIKVKSIQLPQMLFVRCFLMSYRKLSNINHVSRQFYRI